MRIRVDIEITKPLRRFIMLSNTTGKNDLWAQLSYERLPLFCYDCGIIGHSKIECIMEKGTVDMIKPRQYGDWLRAEPLGRRGYLSNSNLEK